MPDWSPSNGHEVKADAYETCVALFGSEGREKPNRTSFNFGLNLGQSIRHRNLRATVSELLGRDSRSHDRNVPA